MNRTFRPIFCAVVAVCLIALGGQAHAALWNFDNGGGRSGTADFTLVGGGSSLQIVLTNTSSTPPDAANGILTSLAFQLPTGVTITAGSATVTAGSNSVNFATTGGGPPTPVSIAGGDDVSGEYGYGNGGGTGFGSLINYVSGNVSGVTPFGGVNRDAGTNLNGPQGGLVASGWVPGGLGGIENSVTFLLSLSQIIGDLSFLDNGAVIEFGSDDLFLPGTPDPDPNPSPDVPEPTTLALIGLGVAALLRRRRTPA